MPQTLGWSPTTLETPKKGSPADLPSKQFFKDFFLKSPNKRGGVTPRFRSGPLPHQSGREISPAFRARFFEVWHFETERFGV